MLDKLLRISSAIALVTLVCSLPSMACAVDLNPSVGLGFELTSGDYGTGTNTTAVFVPFTVSVEPTERLGLTLEIPYVYQNNTNVIAGQFHQGQNRQMSMQKTLAAMGSPGSGSGMMQSTTNSDPSLARGGLGDIRLRAAYTIVDESDSIPQIRPSVQLKFPTADRDRGLGTGEFDEELAVEVSKWFGNWYTFIEPGYTFQGKTPDIPLKDFATCNAGMGYQATDNLRPMIILKAAGAPEEGSTALLEARLKLKYQATRQTGIEGYIAKGITTSSPDYGTGLAVYYEF